MVTANAIKRFQDKVFQHYAMFGRDLPWRRTTDPYSIWISEVMLQQTQVQRVIDYFSRWLAKWPAVQDLAMASRADVLRQWMGLGYNSRAINLHKAAQKIVEAYEGNVMHAMVNHHEIPGVGPYTAHAVRIFSGNEDLVTVDTNVRRILIHEFRLHEKTPDKQLWSLATQCLPRGRSREWHNALMDYGAMLLTSRKTGIKPKTRQSMFEGSDRQIRAKLIRHLLQKACSIDELHVVTKNRARLQAILAKMIKEGMITQGSGKYEISQ